MTLKVCCCPDESSSPWFHVESGPWGWHVQSKQRIPMGTVIIQNAALSHIWYSNNNNDIIHRRRRRRCSYCGITDPKKVTFQSCSACRGANIYYCGRICQRKDYPQHRIECLYLRNQVLVLVHSSTGGENIRLLEERDEIRCLLRIYGSLQKCKLDCGTNHLERNKSKKNINPINNTTHCGSHHWMQMIPTKRTVESNIESSFTNDRIVSIVQQYTPTWTVMDILRARQVITRNNFGILDQNNLETIGQGVYPQASLWNHSCDPNCLVRFGVSSNSSSSCIKDDAKSMQEDCTTLQMVAIQDIPPGMELTHSYVDLSYDTSTRQEYLYHNHGFVCDCRRCQGLMTVQLPRSIIVDKDYNGIYHWIVTNYNPFVQDTEKNNHESLYHELNDTISISIDDAISSYYGIDETNLDRVHSNSPHMESVNIQEPLHPQIHQSLEDEVSSLRTILSNMMMGKVSPLSQELYKVRGQLLSALLDLDSNKLTSCEENKRYNHSKEMYHQCQAMVAFLCIVMPSNHPLLGLQLFTLGDLMNNNNNDDDDDDDHSSRTDIYRWARHVLRISHGPQHNLIHQLDIRLSK
jgi:SET domain/MYND finger